MQYYGVYAVRSEFTTEIRCCYCGCHCCVPNADRDDRARSKKKEIMDKRTKRHVRIAARGNERLSQEIVGNPKGVKKKDRHAPYIYLNCPGTLTDVQYTIATLILKYIPNIPNPVVQYPAPAGTVHQISTVPGTSVQYIPVQYPGPARVLYPGRLLIHFR
jgi:hypothetical protein